MLAKPRDRFTPDLSQAGTDDASTWASPRRQRLMMRVRPEHQIGGFTRDDPAIMFHLRIQALLRPDMTVLDFGCGRGTSVQPQFRSFHAEVQRVKGKVARVVGVDVDRGVLDHPCLDEGLVIDRGAPLPFSDGTFDLVISKWVVEHLDDPAGFAHEMYRLLKPGGWLCALTPNRFGYVGIFTNLVPQNWHSQLLGVISPERAARDIFPTCYRLNTLGAVHRHFPETLWTSASYAYCGTPRYHSDSYLLFSLISAYQQLMPPALRTDLMIFLQKKDS